MFRVSLCAALFLNGASGMEGPGAIEVPADAHPAYPEADLTDADGQVTVGMITWNVADLGGGGNDYDDNSLALRMALENALKDGPDLFAFAYQENLQPWKFQEWVQVTAGELMQREGEKPHYEIVDHKWHQSNVATIASWMPGVSGPSHGASGVMVWKNKESMQPDATGAVGEIMSENKMFIKGQGNNEKALSAVTVEVNDKKLCFASTHLSPGHWMDKKDEGARDKKRVAEFAKWAKMLDDGGCAAAWFGGDFNWRNAAWEELKTPVHPHFGDDDVIGYFAHTDFSGGFMPASSDEPHPGLRKLQGSVGGPTEATDGPAEATDERTLRPDGWLEAHGTSAKDQINYPPTFQPAMCPVAGASSSVCGEATEKDDKLFITKKVGCGDGGTLDAQTSAEMSKAAAGGKKISSKAPVCFKTKGGGNCGKGYGTKGPMSKIIEERTHICLSAMRPVCFTDAIYHKSYEVGAHKVEIQNVAYGPVILPQRSDHFPMLGRWVVPIAAEKVPVAAEKLRFKSDTRAHLRRVERAKEHAHQRKLHHQHHAKAGAALVPKESRKPRAGPR